MSKIENAKTKCPCGAELHFSVKKPTFHIPSISKVSCIECDSRFLMFVEIDRYRKYSCHFEVIHLSEKAKSKSANPLRQLASTVIEKVSKRDDDLSF